MEQEIEQCYQCGSAECKGVGLIYCPQTNVYHDASDRALIELYGSAPHLQPHNLPLI